jgi:hypothetical protein
LLATTIICSNKTQHIHRFSSSSFVRDVSEAFESGFIIGRWVSPFRKVFNGFGLEVMLNMISLLAKAIVSEQRLQPTPLTWGG